LKERVADVQVIHMAGHLMERQLDLPAGAILRAEIEEMGVRVHLDKATAAILGEDAVTGIEFADGSKAPCEMVVIACGVRPNVELARAAGLAVERAIVVDDQMRSVTDPAVYAVGECVQHRGQVYGLVAPLWEQARVLAEHLTGRRPDGAYLGSKVAAKLKVMGVELTSMGVTEPQDDQDEVVQFIAAKDGVYKKLVIRDGKLIGGILIGDGDRAPYLMQLFDRESPLPRERAALLFDLGGRPGTVTPETMAEDATVCHCNGVSKGEIRECAASGAASMHAVMQLTRAGTGCGSCKSLVRALLEAALGSGLCALGEDGASHVA
jgi:nitrite reductase (NADH) large subunit